MNTELKNKIVNHIRKNDWVTYFEVERLFEESNFDYKGELAICSPICDNVIWWCGWNEEAIKLINELKVENLIYQDIAQPLLYLIDGKGLTLPIVKRNVQYKTEHWLPIAFRPVIQGD